VYLDCLVRTEPSTFGVGLVRLIVELKKTTAALARILIEQAQTDPLPLLDAAAIIELVDMIVMYKFPRLNRQEIAEILGISELRQTKVFEEFYDEGLQQGLEQGFQQGQQQGQPEGRHQEGVAFVLRLLTRRFGEVPAAMRAEISGLSVAQLEDFGEALLEFGGLSDLQVWLSQHPFG
jgi:predicted transposase YdaD